MKIINQSQKRRYKNIDKTVNKLLKSIPGEHLLGLDSLILADDIFNKGYEDCRGLYWPKKGLKKARIEIGLNNIFKNQSKMVFVPYLGKYALARILFHEIGHHVKEMKHGISKNDEEYFAEQYSKKYSQLALKNWDFLLTPLKPLLMFLGKKYLKWKKIEF